MPKCPVCFGDIEVATKDNPALYCKYCGLRVWSIFSEDEPRFYGLLSAIGISMRFKDVSAEKLISDVKAHLKNIRI